MKKIAPVTIFALLLAAGFRASGQAGRAAPPADHGMSVERPAVPAFDLGLGQIKSCPYGDGLYCGGVIPGDANVLYMCEGGKLSVQTKCGSNGCQVNPPHVPDQCGDGSSGAAPSVYVGGASHCGDYPANWCAMGPDLRITIGGRIMLNRECVAYVAYKRWKAGKPFATGNAGDWPGDSQTPTVGSVAIWNNGTVSRVGHVAYVAEVNAGAIIIQEFNWNKFSYDSRRITMKDRGWPSRFWN